VTDIERQEFLNHVIEGLSQEQKELSPKYFYDARGCEIYEEIKDLDEYYLTRHERSLLKNIVGEIESLLPTIRRVVEYGGGSGRRTQTLISSLKQIVEYLPIDVAMEQLEATAASIKVIRPDLEISPLLGDFAHLPAMPECCPTERLGFLPGSTIGNFTFEGAKDFLNRIHQQIGEGLRAYNDAKGVTARFNLNVLNRMNRELDANFDLRFFKHESRFNDDKSRVEMHLVSIIEQKVNIGEQQISFAKDESIHTENSHKYTPELFAQLIEGTGWSEQQTWLDDQGYYAMTVLSG